MKIEIESLVSAFEHDNAQLAAPTDAMFAGFIAHRPSHARFLNTLSMLEHLGSHKIMATQHGAGIEQPTLKHLADETRHAFFFKRHADREAGRTMEYDADDLVVPFAARRYFHRLEAEIVRALPPRPDRRIAYLIMSMIVEFRAVWAYRLYHAALNRAGHMVSLKGLLAEENGHLTDMAERLEKLTALDPGHIRGLCLIETRLYRKFLSSLTGAVATLPSGIENAATTAGQLFAAVG
jgi:hypothetical protein